MQAYTTAGRKSSEAGRSRAEARRVARMRRDLRRCDEVNVYAGHELGFVRVTKKEAAKLIRKKGGAMVGRFVWEFNDLYLEPCPF